MDKNLKIKRGVGVNWGCRRAQGQGYPGYLDGRARKDGEGSVVEKNR
jgi:hypothetical protein